MGAIKIQFDGKVKLVYDEARNGRVNRYLVAVDESGNFPNTLRFKLKNGLETSAAEGDEVTISAFVDGRDWTGQDGKTYYFTDLTAVSVEVAAKSGTGGGGHAVDLKGVYAKWKANNGGADNRDGFVAFCVKSIPGKKIAEYTAADVAVLDALVTPEAADDDLPF